MRQDKARKILLGSVLLFLAAAALLAFRTSKIIRAGYTTPDCMPRLYLAQNKTALPGCTGFRDLGGGPVPIHFNEHGYRDLDRPKERAKGVFRVLLLGASLHVAPGLPEELNPARVAEQELARLGFRNVEVLNLSVEGFSTIHHAENLSSYVSWHPSFVVLATVDSHKPFRDLWIADLLRRGPEGLEMNYAAIPFGETFLFQLSTMLIRASVHYAQARRQLELSRELAAIPPGPARADALLRNTVALMAEMKRRFSEAGAGFGFLWDGKPLTNQVALRINDSPALASAYGPFLATVEVTGQEAADAFRRAGQLPLDISPSAIGPGDFIGDTYYLNERGMEKFGKALAGALAPLLPRETRARK